ncbi:MAG: phosphatase [Lachnospiraceae bacterium]|nr:phosphatase [Lachnospiraceae bacterium]
MNIVADMHCHTIASVHAYSTLRDNLNAAKKKGIQTLAITDHGIGCADSPSLNYFDNLLSLPREVEGVRLIRGVEANIMDFHGKLDMPEELLKRMDFVIASFHTACTDSGTVEEHTRAYKKIAENPLVHMIGHSGSAEFVYDYEYIIPLFKKYKKIVEINAHTFICREKSVENCMRIARLCKEYEVPVMVNSDAHSEFEVGACDKAFEMLHCIDFPKELIVNVSQSRMEKYLSDIGPL